MKKKMNMAYNKIKPTRINTLNHNKLADHYK